MIDYNIIITAAIVAVPTVCATTIVPIWLDRSRRMDRRLERFEDREALALAAKKAEEVAEQARLVAKLLVVKTEKMTQQTADLTTKVEKVGEVGNMVHTLVNSKLTETMKKLRDAKAETLDLMKSSSPDNKVSIGILADELRALEMELGVRAVATDKAAADQKIEQSDNKT
jgi:hypothetical protein